jgi:hypothetical protein
MERRLAPHWQGTAGSAASEATNSPTDYERACLIGDYIGLVELPGGNALILGDMPLSTSVWRKDSVIVHIVRVFYTDDLVDISSFLLSIGAESFEDPDEILQFSVASSQMRIFDSAFPGSAVAGPELSFEVVPGTYRILTKIIDSFERTSFIVHRLNLLI